MAGTAALGLQDDEIERALERLEKVCTNLLSNAVKFTPAGGRVSFSVDVVDGPARELVLVVEDDEPGIPQEEHGRVFERFHQVDGSASRAHEGAGLGLALVKEIAELHGGSVSLSSSPGRGSRFTVRVPAGDAVADHTDRAEPIADAVPADLRAGTRAVPTPSPQRTDTRSRVAHPAEPDVDDATRRTVLVVEDHDALRAYLRHPLEERYRVIEAANGVDGLAEARRSVPDLILCDIMMPGMDGEEMCRAIRADPEVAYLPVIMVTAKASRRSRLSALEGGADDYLVKPFDPETLRLRIANALASRKRLAERLRSEGMGLPTVALDLPGWDPGRSFAERLKATMGARMAAEDFGVDEMAGAMAMSRATLFRKAEEELAMPPLGLLWQFRLQHAARWLRETDGTVSEIAYASGFKTVPHFTRRFKAQFAVTPAAYRREHVWRRSQPSTRGHRFSSASCTWSATRCATSAGSIARPSCANRAGSTARQPWKRPRLPSRRSATRGMRDGAHHSPLAHAPVESDPLLRCCG